MSDSQEEASLAPAHEPEVSPGREPTEGVEPSEFVVPAEFAENQLEIPQTTEEPHGIEQPLFTEYSRPEPPQPPRIPDLGHVLILGLLGVFGFLGSGLLTRSALYFHLWGVSTIQAAMTDVHYTIASMASLYIITFGGAAIVFPLVWQKSMAAGLQWNGHGAIRRLGPLLGASGVCFVLAMVDEIILPGPTNAPIDQLFHTSTAAWLLFAFGVTFAPLFEETIFRGFLLPAFATAFDWAVEKTSQMAPLPLDYFGHPNWSLAGMVFASVATSVPFALMHAEQTGWALGPFLLLVAVSLVLCWARLSTRSLAASVIVHAGYNFLLFALMLLGTHGFKHMDKM